MSLAEIAYFVLSFASLTLPRKVEKGPQLIVASVVMAVVAAVVVAVAAVAFVVVSLEEERMACFDQQHFGKKEQAVVVVEGWTI